MGEAKSHNIVALPESLKAHYLIKLTQLLVSLSLCYFLFSPSSLLAFLHYFDFYFSSFPLQIFSHTIDKNLVFLLCNGLLVFVGIARSFSGSSPDLEDESSKHNIEKVMIEKEESEVKASEIDEVVEEQEEDSEMAIVEEDEEEEEGKGSGLLGLKEEEDEESGILEAGDNEEEEKGTKNEEFLIEENEEEGKEIVEEENWRLTTEEMNKKFDDFIRRMKKDLGIQAERQLVMV